MTLSAAIRIMRHLAMLAVMSLVWILLAMVYLEKFPPPFDRILHWLMPWKSIYKVSFETSLQERLRFMQDVLDSSHTVSEAAFLVMVVSFVAFSSYLVLVYQQRQRRASENRLLLIKNREIARRNEFIRYISATIGHEFKNNLGRIKRRIDLFDLTGEAREKLDVNLNKLFSDIDIFKKISDEREAGLVEFQEVNLKEMLLGLKKQYSDLAEFTFKGGFMASTTIYASPTLLGTVLENLVDNAVKYRKPGQERAHITLSCTLDADGTRRYVSLSIWDDGAGMDEEQADRCFYKGRGSGEGWGQGLYFAKYVVGLHAGKIRVGKENTALGEGTEIIINLPFVEETMDV
jgi:signal transduction histidine kinase